MTDPIYRPFHHLGMDRAQAAAIMEGAADPGRTSCIPDPTTVLTADEKALVHRLLGLFAKSDEGVGTATMPPTYDEFIASLPD